MFFTYHKEDKVVLLTTDYQGKKYTDIVENPNVSVLLHSFEGKAATQSSFVAQKPCSVTLYSKAYFADGEKDAEFKQTCSEAHPNWGEAFKGD